VKILVANFGSTSFKYKLFEADAGAETLLAKGAFDRVEDFGPPVEQALRELQEGGHLAGLEDLDAVGFKTVLGKDLSGCVEADERVLAALDGLKAVAPAHNPAYAAGIRSFREKAPGARLVALFETAFYQWVPEAARHYAIPKGWREAGIRRYGFHGASHKFIAERSAELLGREDVARRVRGLYANGPGPEPEMPLRVVSCHLGGSSSVTGINSGLAVGCSLGFSPQSGLPHNNRVGDLDSMAIPFAMNEMGLSLAECERQLTQESGLYGLSGVGNDLRDVEAAARKGNAEAQLAIDVLIHSIRQWVGVFLVQMGGLDGIAFTGGIGEHNPWLRKAVCEGLEELGVQLDKQENASREEGLLGTDDADCQVMVIPANEELVIAREVRRFVESKAAVKS